MSKLAKRALASVAGLAVVFTAVMGLAHTWPGRPILAFLAGGRATGGACPLGYDVARTPEQKEAARRAFAVSHAGEERAAERPALGFALERITRADVSAWALAHGVVCKVPRSGPDLDCADVPDAALPSAYRGAPILSLWLSFGASGALASVVVVRRSPEAATISATFEAVTSTLAREAGPATVVEGNPRASRLSVGLLRQSSAEYRFRDYYAVARATNMGDGFALTEEYRALPD